MVSYFVCFIPPKISRWILIQKSKTCLDISGAHRPVFVLKFWVVFIIRCVSACISTCPDRTACLVNSHLWRHMHEHFGVLTSGYVRSCYYSSRQRARWGGIGADWKGFAGVDTPQGGSKRSRGGANNGDATSSLGAQGQGNFWLTAARNSPAVKEKCEVQDPLHWLCNRNIHTFNTSTWTFKGLCLVIFFLTT